MPKLTVMPEGVTVELDAGETILEGLYRNGYAYRVGCRRGGCAICKVNVLSGEVSYNRPVADKVLPEQERSEGICLSCRAVAESELVIELREDTLRQVSPILSMFAVKKPTV